MTNRVGKLCALLCAAAAFFPALAQAQSGVFRVYAGLAPTSYRITLNIPGAFNATAKSNYAAANLGATWVSPRGVYVDVSGQTSLNAKHDLWDSTGAGHSSASETLCGRIIAALKAEALLNESVGAGYIDRNWPPAFKDSAAWPLASLRQSFLNGALTRCSVSQFHEAGG